MVKKVQNIAASLARADMIFWLMPALMLLLVAGTVAQAPLGLYAAQKMFFGTFIFWAGPLPLPGGYTLIGIISISLAVKFLLHSEWTLAKAGINLTHFGVLVLLFGGLLTAMLARESFMLIPEGAESRYLYDYHQRQLYIFENDILEQAIDFENRAAISGVPFEMKITQRCANCAISKREETGGFHGMAQFMELNDSPASKDPEADISGLTFTIKGLGEQDGTYIAFEGMPEPIILTAKKKNYKIIFGKQQTALPFSIRLREFTRETYPGTDKAKAYMSDVVVMDNSVEWPARIEMNAPLRYKGYTFYQSSFEQSPDTQATILSVVENKGRLFPYLGTLIMAAGLLLHIVLAMRNKTP